MSAFAAMSLMKLEFIFGQIQEVIHRIMIFKNPNKVKYIHSTIVLFNHQVVLCAHSTETSHQNTSVTSKYNCHISVTKPLIKMQTSHQIVDKRRAQERHFKNCTPVDCILDQNGFYYGAAFLPDSTVVLNA